MKKTSIRSEAQKLGLAIRIRIRDPQLILESESGIRFLIADSDS